MFSFLSNKFEQIFDFVKGIEKITDESMGKILNLVKDVLIESDTPISTINYFLESLKNRCVGTRISKIMKPEEFISKQLYDVLIEVFGGENKGKKDPLKTEFLNKKNKQFIIMVAGLQGAGKTTTISKILKSITIGKESFCKNEDILTASLDYVRPASRKQLEILSNENSVSFFDTTGIENIFNGAKEILNRAKKLNKNIIIVDTAGRISVDENMMLELKEIYLIIKPDVSFLVIDSMSGQKGLQIAKEFTQTIKFNGVILTKTDSNAPSGVSLGIVKELNIPILYATSGEKKDDFEIFNPVKIVRRVLGVGDFLSLAEMANDKIAKSEEDIIKNTLKKGDISIEEYIKILKMIESMGPLKKLVSMVPKDMTGNKKIDDDKIAEMEDNNKKFKFMCDSMNKKERKAPELVFENYSRKNRISKGSGLPQKKIDELLNQYKVMKEQLKGMSHYLKHLI